MTDTFTVNDGYITLPVTTDPDTLQQNALAAIATTLPGWVPRDSHIEVLLLEQIAAAAAESANVAALVPEVIFQFFGALLGIQPELGSVATAQTTWTMVDTAGYTVPANTLVGYAVVASNALYIFQTTEDFTVSPGDLTATGITISATNVGTTYNGFLPIDYPFLTVVTTLSFVATVQPTTTTSGGANAETTAAYMDRLSNELKLLTPRPILPPDFAELALNISGVYRAAAWNGVNPFSNQLVVADAVPDAGTWTNATNCTTSYTTGSDGENVIRLTTTGGGDASVNTDGPYPVAEGTPVLGSVSWDIPSAVDTVQVGIIWYDVTGSEITHDLGPMVSESASAPCVCTVVAAVAPPNTVKMELLAVVNGPSASETHDIATSGLFAWTEASENQVPNSSILNEIAPHVCSWVPTSGISAAIFATNTYSFHYTGTGSGSGTKTATSEWFYLPAGTYTVSGYIDATEVSSGSPQLTLTALTGTPFPGPSGSLSVTQTATMSGTVSTTFTLGSDAVVQYVFDTNNCTATTGLDLIFAQPYVALSSFTDGYTAGPTWNPGGLIYNNERMVTVSPTDSAGDDLSDAVNQAVSAYLESLREINFVVNVIGPSHTPISVTWAGVAAEGYSPTAVQAAGNAALTNYLSAGLWAGGAATPPFWDPTQTTVHYLSVVGVLDNVPGVDYLTSVAIGITGGSLGTSDVGLIGFAPLPLPGAIVGSVT